MTVITDSPLLGGQAYPLLRDYPGWSITSTPLGDRKVMRNLLNHIDGITMRWVRDDGVNDLRVPGFSNPDDFLKHVGIEVSLDKGVFQFSKRWSRIFRPHFFWEIFQEDEVRIYYDPDLDLKQFDGAGYISRKFLKKLGNHFPAHKERVLKRELKTTQRWAFSVLSRKGEDKGHLIVKDRMKYDLILPLDTKSEIKLVNGKLFVGLHPIHSADAMWLDIQSNINLNPFFDPNWLVENMDRMGDFFLESIKTEELSTILEYVKTFKEIEGWEVREYIASGGKAMWFGAVVRALGQQHLRLIQARSIDKLRAPIPGGYYYVLSSEVVGRDIPEGHIQLDASLASAIVSTKDWGWISEVLGGADQDDALWCYPFVDSTGTRQVIAWRSPNQLGEYVVLKPFGDIPFAQWLSHDERLLPTRIDRRDTHSLGLVEPVAWASVPYSIGACAGAVKQANANTGVLGQTVNLQMVLKATTGDIGDTQPDRLEAIIDGTVKIGANLIRVKHWNTNYARRWFMKHTQVPHMLHPRIKGMLGESMMVYIEPTFDHWLDRFFAATQTHIHAYTHKLHQLSYTAMPPIAVFEYGRNHLLPALRVKEAYAAEIRNKIARGLEFEDEYDDARIASEAIMREYPAEEYTRIVAGIAARTYVLSDPTMRDGKLIHASDAVMWQLGKLQEDGSRRRGFVNITLEMLRELGLIGDLMQTQDGLIAYYAEDHLVETGVPIQVNGAWFAYANFQRTQRNLKPLDKMGQMPKAERAQVKDEFGALMNNGLYNGRQMEIKSEGDRKVVYSNGRKLGYIQRGHELRVGEILTPRYVTTVDGNMLVIAEKA